MAGKKRCKGENTYKKRRCSVDFRQKVSHQKALHLQRKSVKNHQKTL